ncbi:MAG: SusC/RagA family TonB-linked outer membrane protein [Flavobacteriales bacterium]|nr:SusC/RagA family TonB-linked outer membrane protein [Flavobacteriales bacterium]
MAKHLLVAFFVLISVSVFAQTGTVKGVVTGDDGLSIIGGTVVVEGTTIGASTDFDGKYELKNVPVGEQTIVYSFIGLKTQRLKVTVKENETVVSDVKLSEDAMLLDQVVVVGYGTTQKRDVTGSISTVKAEAIEQSTLPSVDQALQGQAAGVNIISQNGISGSAVKINVRGTNSIAAGSQPLIVVDGIPITTGNFDPGNLGSSSNALSDINPNDIESIEVLKDAAATAIYGSRGANGVVMITTKRGKAGKSRINVGYSYGIVNETNRVKFLNASEHLALRDQARADAGLSPESPTASVGGGLTRAEADSVAKSGGVDWVDKMLRTGGVHQLELSSSGGTEKVRYYVGGAYRNERGFLRGNNYDRANGRVNLDADATKILRVGGSVAITYTSIDRVRTGDAGGLGTAQQILPYIPVYDANGEYNNYISNPVRDLDLFKFNTENIRSINSVYADLKLQKNLTFHSDFGIDFLNQLENEFNFRNVNLVGSTSSAWNRTTRVVNWNMNNFLTYEKEWKGKHYFKMMVGQSAQHVKTQGFGLYGWGFPNDYLTSPAAAPPDHQSGYSYQTANGLLSFFSRINYKLNNRYLLGVSVRGDASSRFGPHNKWGFFPAFSAGWVISDESFLKGSKVLPYLKLSASYGYTGNNAIPDFAYWSLYSSGFNYADSAGVAPSQLDNPNLKWERSQQLDVNIDFALVQSKIFGTITYYRKTSSDLLLYMSLPTSSGFNGVWQNIGKLQNWGMEFSLTSRNINRKFKWETNVNVAFNRNKVISAAGLPPDAFESGQPGEGRVIEGYPVGQAYLVEFAGVQKQDGQIGAWNLDGTAMLDGNGNQVMYDVAGGTELFYDKNGHIMTYAHPTGGLFYENNRKPMGSPLPLFYGGFTNTFSYAGIDLSVMFSFSYGNTIYDDAAKTQIGNWQSIAQRREILNAWSPTNTNTDVPGLNNYTPVNSSRFLYDGSYLRLRSLILGYNFPKKICEKAHLQKLRLYFKGGNLWLLTAFPGWDPEVLRNVDPNSQAGNVSFAGPYLGTPQARTISFGIQIGI